MDIIMTKKSCNCKCPKKKRILGIQPSLYQAKCLNCSWHYESYSEDQANRIAQDHMDKTGHKVIVRIIN